MAITYPATSGGVSNDWILGVIHWCNLVLRFLSSVHDFAKIVASLSQPDLTVVLPQTLEPNGEQVLLSVIEGSLVLYDTQVLYLQGRVDLNRVYDIAHFVFLHK